MQYVGSEVANSRHILFAPLATAPVYLSAMPANHAIACMKRKANAQICHLPNFYYAMAFYWGTVKKQLVYRPP